LKEKRIHSTYVPRRLLTLFMCNPYFIGLKKIKVKISYLVRATRFLNNVHQVRSKSRSSGMLEITFIRYARNHVHQVRSKSRSSGTLEITFIRYASHVHQVRSKSRSSGTLEIEKLKS